MTEDQNLQLKVVKQTKSYELLYDMKHSIYRLQTEYYTSGTAGKIIILI